MKDPKEFLRRLADLLEEFDASIITAHEGDGRIRIALGRQEVFEGSLQYDAPISLRNQCDYL